jgi:hypothetical protein
MMAIATLTDLGESEWARALAEESEAIGRSNPFWVRMVVQMQAAQQDWASARQTLQRFETATPGGATETFKLLESHVLATGRELDAVKTLLARCQAQWPHFFGEKPEIRSIDDSLVFPYVLQLASMAKDDDLTKRLGETIRAMLPQSPSPEELIAAAGNATLIDVYAVLGERETAWTLLRAAIGDPPTPSSGWRVLKTRSVSPVATALAEKQDFQRWLAELERRVQIQREAFRADERVPVLGAEAAKSAK